MIKDLFSDRGMVAFTSDKKRQIYVNEILTWIVNKNVCCP